MTQPILIEVADRIATLTLNVPDKRNAMSEQMTLDFPGYIDEVRASGARALIVTGAGSAFCAGGDLGFLHSGEPDPITIREKMTSFYPRFLSLLELDIPVIAAINGPAVGAGMCLALMCDLRVASTNAKMSMPFVKIGIHPGMQANALLLRAVNGTHAADLLYTGRTVDGTEAHRMGLVNRVCEPDDLTTTARALAEEVASNAPIALRFLKQGLRETFSDLHRKASSWEGWAQPVTMATADTREGLKAISERRSPTFEGR